MQKRRGNLNKEINEIAIDFLGREIDVLELRLYPYLSYIAINLCELEPDKIEDSELKVLKKLEQEGHLKLISHKVIFTSEFYLFIHNVLYLSYVRYTKEDFKEEWDAI